MPGPPADIAGRLEVPTGGEFTIEIKVYADPPVWSVELVGNGVTMPIGADQSPFTKKVPGLADGYYVLTIQATLTSDQGRFQLIAKSEIDDERKELVMIPGAAKRYDMMPVVVGIGA
jgi:hypothetical protein